MKYKNIEKNFDDLLKKQSDAGWGTPGRYLKEEEAVWFAGADRSAPYETDQEWLGIKRDGTFIWAYASGCSCWDGDYSIGGCEKTIKSFEFRNLTHKEWEGALQEFEKTLEIQAL